MNVRNLNATTNHFHKQNDTRTNALTLTRSQREREFRS